MKQALTPEAEVRLIEDIRNKHQRQFLHSDIESLSSPLVHWAKDHFGDDIAGDNDADFSELLSAPFVRECLQ